MFLPAIDVETERLVYPQNGIKGRIYSCPGCEGILKFKKGEVRSPYFSHTSKGSCTYTDHPSESDIHKQLSFCFLIT